MRVSYYNFRRMHEFLSEEVDSELKELFSLDNYPKLQEYRNNAERVIGKSLCPGHAIGTHSGTAALQFSLAALGIGKDDEVITTPYTFIATLLAISNAGAKPVLVDISNETMLMDLDKVESKITKKTKAIMPVHLYGQMLDMQKIGRIAKKHGLLVIEDACQSHLSRHKGKLAGNYGDAVCYSFSLPKVLGSVGGGGMVISKKKKIIDNVAGLRNPTSNSQLLLRSLRTPAFLSFIQAALLMPRLKYLKEWVNRRKEIANTYCKELAGLPITLPGKDKFAGHVFSDFVIRTKKDITRKMLKKYLQIRGIEVIPNYFPLPHLNSFSYLGYKRGDFPVAESISGKALSLPTTPFLTNKEVDYIIKCIKSFFRYNILA